MTPAVCVAVIFLSLTMGICTAVLIFLTIIDSDRKKLLAGKKILILALLVDAAFVFALQVWRVSFAWVFVSLYWAILTGLNFLNWKGGKDEK